MKKGQEHYPRRTSWLLSLDIKDQNILIIVHHNDIIKTTYVYFSNISEQNC